MIYITSPLADGLQAVYDGVIRVLELNILEPEVKCQFLQYAVDIVGMRSWASTSLKLGDYMKIRALVSDVQGSNQGLVQQFLGHFTNCKRKTFYFP